MPVSKFEDFAENMMHEFRFIDTAIDKVGYKVDGEGIKTHCKCRTLKSVDYFYEHDADLSLVEFSDLPAQHDQIKRRIECLMQSDMDKKEKIRFVKDVSSTIHQEMRKKYIDSLHIISGMEGNIHDVPDWVKKTKGKYFIVVPPMLNDAPEDKRAEISRMLDMLKNDLSLAIPEHLFVSVSVTQLPEFLSN
ncbi:hypothetical protein PX046_17820 [Enterobacter hormaechei]|jgi:hypothetical protein|nr:hypothetical protein [Enterobacter roggenkampii]HEC0615684.1 hypothetical protein [Enterobacter hormaechei]